MELYVRSNTINQEINQNIKILKDRIDNLKQKIKSSENKHFIDFLNNEILIHSNNILLFEKTLLLMDDSKNYFSTNFYDSFSNITIFK